MNRGHPLTLAAALTLACSHQRPLEPPPPDAGPAPDAAVAPPSDDAPPTAAPAPPTEAPAAAGGAPSCLLDADCAARARCEAGACVVGCRYQSECPGKTPTCGPHGICLAGTGSPDRPLVGAPTLDLIDLDARRFALTQAGRRCGEGTVGGLDPLDGVRVEALSAGAATVTPDGDGCTFTLDPGGPGTGRRPIRVRAATEAGVAWFEYPHVPALGRRFVGVLTAETGGAPLRLPMVFTLDAPLSDGPATGVVEAAGTPLVTDDRTLYVDATPRGWRFVTRDTRPTHLLRGAFGGAGPVATHLEVIVEAAPEPRGALIGRFTLGLANGEGAPRQLDGRAVVWPAPEHDTPPTAAPTEPAALGPPGDHHHRCDPVYLAPPHLEGTGLATCLAGDACCDGPGPARGSPHPMLWDALWAQFVEGVDSEGNPHLARVCVRAVDGCRDPGDRACYTWPSCGAPVEPCALPPVVGDPYDAACADALAPDRLEVVRPLTAPAPSCVDVLRLICATVAHGRAADVDWAAIDALHADLLRAGRSAADQMTDPTDGLDRLATPLAEVLHPSWRAADRPPRSAALADAWLDAAAAWMSHVEHITLDALVEPAALADAHQRALDGLTLVAAAQRDLLGDRPPSPAHAELVTAVERTLWRVAAVQAPPDDIVATPARVAQPGGVAAPRSADWTLLDAALAGRDHALVLIGRLEARRADFDRWYAELEAPIEALEEAHAPTAAPAPALARVERTLRVMARQPLTDPWLPHALDHPDGDPEGPPMGALADALAAATTRRTPPPPPPGGALLSWPPPLDAALAALDGDPWLEILDAERAATEAALDDLVTELTALSDAHAVAVRARLAARLADGVDRLGGPPTYATADAARAADDAYRLDGRAERPTAEADAYDHVVRRAHPVSLACDVFDTCAAPRPLRDTARVPSEVLVTPAEQWRAHLDRASRGGVITVEFEVTPTDGVCSRRLLAVEIRSAEADGAAPLDDATLTPIGPRVDHRCAGLRPTLVVGIAAPLSPGAVDPDRVGPPGGRWRLTLPPSARALTDVTVTFTYDGLVPRGAR